MKDAIESLQKALDSQLEQTRLWQEKHDREALKFREDILGRLRPFEDFAISVQWLCKIVGFAAAFIWGCVKAWIWLKDNLR